MAYVFVLNLDYIPFHRILEESHLLSDWNLQLKNRYNACWSSTCRRNINDYWSSATSTLLLSMKSTWVCFISKRFHLDEVTVYDTAGWDFKDWSSISCKKKFEFVDIVCCRHLFTMVDLVLFQKHEMKVYPKLNLLNKIISLY